MKHPMEYVEEADANPRDFGAQDTRNILDVLVEALDGADRVVIETKNALGEMDAHYLHAPEVLRGIQRHLKEANKQYGKRVE